MGVGAREVQTPFTPAASSSGHGVEPTDLEEEEDKVDLYSEGVLPDGISSSVVVQGSTKTQPVAEHVPVCWDSQISYNSCTERQHQDIEALLATHQIYNQVV